ncbi:uncharacterized protein SPSK_05755 [Sporothrix schenckii 1099-18]|uniref:Uncharacterized protein n=1 Tax=Sporothrix schenckii 1099-18 TaxID=1397361 RepID=A0A0F2LW68_SPOSC|nr:uncharacterized protein SPSK_05755 [Sporothrix schenckii 1099-18]KJR81074.1 hypothetical protein SPSK_05755 [Sporothrix schenckii 1099-18]
MATIRGESPGHKFIDFAMRSKYKEGGLVEFKRHDHRTNQDSNHSKAANYLRKCQVNKIGARRMQESEVTRS